MTRGRRKGQARGSGFFGATSHGCRWRDGYGSGVRGSRRGDPSPGSDSHRAWLLGEVDDRPVPENGVAGDRPTV